MSNANPAVLGLLNELAQLLLTLQVRLNARKAKFKSDTAELKKEYETDTASIQEEMRRVGAEIWKLIGENRGTLIKSGMKSFVTLAAKFQLKDSPGGIKVTDVDGLMVFARAKGLLKKVAVPPSHQWQYDRRTLLASIDKDPKLREMLAAFIEEDPKVEGLTIQPNDTYLVEHGKDRISPPSVKVEKP
jgi:hypothetical protein